MASQRCDALVWFGLLSLLVFAPLPSASISSFAQASLACGLFAFLAISYAGPRVAFSPRSPGVERRFRLMMLCWAMAVVFALFQIAPLPPDVIGVLSPTTSELYSWTLPVGDHDRSWRALSAAPAATLQSGLLIGACGAAFVLVIRHCITRARILALAIAIILAGMIEAIYGLSRWDGRLDSPVSGTFVNRNHFAAFMIMSLSVGMGLLLSRWRAQREGPTDGASESGMGIDRWARASPLMIATLALLVAIIFSFSRTGLIISLVIVVLFGLVGSMRSVAGLMRFTSIAAMATAVVLVSGAWRGLKVVVDRFEHLQDSYRLAAWQGTYDLFQSSPIVGIGLGGLVDHLSRFLPISIKETFDHTHNEPLELLAEGGIIYGGLVGIGLLIYFSTVIPAWWTRRDALAKGVGWGCLVAACAVLFFSLVEFPLRMPANAFTLSVILALGWVSIHHRAQHAAPAGGPMPSGFFAAQRLIFSLAVAGASLSAVMVMASLLSKAGDALAQQTETETGGARQDALHSAAQLYRSAQRIEPWQPAHAFKLGRVFEATASMLPPISEDTMAMWGAATASYEQALRLHPASARVQAALAWAGLQSGDEMQARRAALAAVRLAPGDPHIRFAVSRWYLVQWENLTREEQHAGAALIRQGVSDLPSEYMDTIWRLIPNVNSIKSLLPGDLPVRRLLLRTLTQRQLFADRWAEQDAHPDLRQASPESGLLVLSHGRLTGRQSLPAGAVSAGTWSGMVEGWLSGGLTATSRVALPPGEAVIFISLRGEPAGGLWPTIHMTLSGQTIPISSVPETGWRTAYVHVDTGGGNFPLQAVLTNGSVDREHDRFVERRIMLGPIRILTPHSVYRSSSVSLPAGDTIPSVAVDGAMRE